MQHVEIPTPSKTETAAQALRRAAGQFFTASAPSTTMNQKSHTGSLEKQFFYC